MTKKDPNSVWIALHNQDVVGGIKLVSSGSNVLFCYRLAIKDEFRNQGIGSSLLLHVEQLAQKKGYKEIGFYVDADNKELQEYYKRRNYTTSYNKYIFMWKSTKK